MSAPTVPAIVNHARWLARCPCGGAERVEIGQPVATCASCGATLRVRWPRPDARAAAGALLELRPDERTRNWESDREAVADLAAENRAHGLPDLNL